MIRADPQVAGGPQVSAKDQLELIVGFGLFAFDCRDADRLLEEACRVAARGVGGAVAGALQHLAGQAGFVLRAGIGWRRRVVGSERVPGGTASPAGYAYDDGEAVLANDLRAEKRFRIPPHLLRHGIERVIEVPVAGAGDPLGVLEVGARGAEAFSTQDLAFVQGIANLLGVAIDRLLSAAALREREEWARLVVEGLRDHAVFTVDGDGRITSWNSGARELLGYDEKEALGLDCAMLFTAEDREAGRPAAELTAARTSGVAVSERWHSAKDGRRFWGSGTIRPLHDSVGRNRGYLKILRDRTEWFLAQQQAQRMNVDLERRVAERSAALLRSEAALHQAQKMEAIGTSTGMVAHDFNNVLTAILGYLALLEDRVKDDATASRFVGAALRAGARGERMAQQLLAFSRHQPGTPEEIDVNAAIRDLEELMLRSIGEGIELHLDLAPDLPRICVDVGHFERALLNLVLNARDVMPDGGVLGVRTSRFMLKPELAQIEAVEAGPYVRIGITDTGPGMKEEVRERAFEPFFTTKPSGAGTGLGLSMVYGFARQSKGRAAILAGPGGVGTEVVIDLPAARRSG